MQSCEHIDDWQNVYEEFPNDVLLVLQSNDLDIPEHIAIDSNNPQKNLKIPTSWKIVHLAAS